MTHVAVTSTPIRASSAGTNDQFNELVRQGRSTIKVRTKNSVYEVDVAGRRIRRIEGVNEPTPRFALRHDDPDDDGWRPYWELDPRHPDCWKPGIRITVSWYSVPGRPNFTVLSPIEEVAP